jgi:hypothetical protein
VSPHKFKRRGEQPALATPPRVGPKTPASPKPTGGPGGEAPWRGVMGGVPPQNLKRGRVAHISNPATSGTQNAGEPKAHGGGQTGVQGGEAPWQGVWGVSPHKFKRRGEQPALATPPRVGPKTPASPKPTGVQGDKAPMAGARGVCPQNKTREGPPTLAAPPRAGPRILASPQPTGVGKRGSMGRSPLAGDENFIDQLAPLPPRNFRNSTPKHKSGWK